MGIGTVLAAPRLLLVGVAAGLAVFVAVHTGLLFSADQPVQVLFRRVWLAGLGLTALLVYLSVTAREPAEE